MRTQHRSTRQKQRRATLARLIALGTASMLMLAGCEAQPEPVEVTPNASWQEIVTQTDSARFRIPPGWSVEDRSAFVPTGSVYEWVNDIAVLDEHGEQQLVYTDRPESDTLGLNDPTDQDRSIPDGVRPPASHDDPTYVSSLAGPNGFEVMAWWTETRVLFSSYDVYIALVDPGHSRTVRSRHGYGNRLHTFGYEPASTPGAAPGREIVRSPEDVERFIEGELGATMLAIISTLELRSTPLSALPVDVEPPGDVGTTAEYDGPLEHYVTADGAIAFDVPHLHSVLDESAEAPVGTAYFLRIIDPFGATAMTIELGDEPALDPLAGSGEITVVDERPVDDRMAATSWYIESERGITLHMALSELGALNPVSFVQLDDGRALAAYVHWPVSESLGVSTPEQARDVLRDVTSSALLDALASIEVRG